MGVEFKVTGLRELQRALRQTQEETPKAIQEAHKTVAEIVAAQARRNLSGTSMTGRVKAFGTTRAAGIRFQGHRPKRRRSVGPTFTEFQTGRAATKSDAFLQEFGGRAPLFGDRNHWHLVKPKRRSGYYVYPAIAATRDQVMAHYLDVLEQALHRHFAD